MPGVETAEYGDGNASKIIGRGFRMLDVHFDKP